MNLLFPVSVSLGMALTAWLAMQAAVPGVTPFGAAGLTFAATMMGLAVIEHWFLVLPLPFARLWDWALTLRRPRQALVPGRLHPSTTAT